MTTPNPKRISIGALITASGISRSTLLRMERSSRIPTSVRVGGRHDRTWTVAEASTIVRNQGREVPADWATS